MTRGRARIRQLRHVRRNGPRLVPGKRLCRDAGDVEINDGELLADTVPYDEIRFAFFNGPRAAEHGDPSLLLSHGRKCTSKATTTMPIRRPAMTTITTSRMIPNSGTSVGPNPLPI
jgi:hypothetical protein